MEKSFSVTYKSKLKGTEDTTVIRNGTNKSEVKKTIEEELDKEITCGYTIKSIEELKISKLQ